MEVGKIIVGDAPRGAREHKIDPRPAWRALAWFSLAFVGAALVDVTLAFYASDLKQPLQRFAAFASAAGTLPLLTIGALGSLMSALGAGSRKLTIAASIVSALLCLGVIAAAVNFFLATGPANLASPEAGKAAIGQALLRAWVFYAVFGLALGVGASIGIRASRGSDET